MGGTVPCGGVGGAVQWGGVGEGNVGLGWVGLHDVVVVAIMTMVVAIAMVLVVIMAVAWHDMAWHEMAVAWRREVCRTHDFPAEWLPTIITLILRRGAMHESPSFEQIAMMPSLPAR